ncbi:MAG: ABC transporter permease [Cyanobacteria bacterium P01_F01_bin.33]
MAPSLYLAWKYLSFNRLKTATLIACITLVSTLPLALNLLLAASEDQLMARAKLTPSVVGSRGSDLDLAINTLYFASKPPEPLAMKEVQEIEDSNLALPIPIATQFTARDYPIVGTTLDYFDFRQLTLAEGNRFTVLGDCVLGAEVAKTLGLEPGDSLVSSPETVFDLGGIYPLKMNVVGVLERTYTADDRAVFVDIKTTWVIQGLGHGHQDLAQPDATELVLERDGNDFVANAQLPQYTEITPDNLASFHFHGATDSFPITAIITVPPDRKSAAILHGRYEVSDGPLQLIKSEQVIEELLIEIFKIRNLLNFVFLLAIAATLLAIALIFNLSLRLRQQEIETSFKLGCSRGAIVRLILAEISLILIVSGSFSMLITTGVGNFKQTITRTLIS